MKKLTEWIDIDSGGIVLLEGVSSSRKEFREFLSFSIFVKTKREERLRRGVERDGAESLELWKSWMREEDEYIARDNPQAFANLIISGEGRYS